MRHHAETSRSIDYVLRSGMQSREWMPQRNKFFGCGRQRLYVVELFGDFFIEIRIPHEIRVYFLEMYFPSQ
jgi:hypothetical protein